MSTKDVEKSKGESLINRPKKGIDDPITPADLVNAVFHGDPKALLHSFGKKGKAQRAKFLKDKKEGKTRHRTFKRGKSGAVSMEETTKEQ